MKISTCLFLPFNLVSGFQTFPGKKHKTYLFFFQEMRETSQISKIDWVSGFKTLGKRTIAEVIEWIYFYETFTC